MSALPQAMTWDEIKANHRDDVKRQAIMFYRSKNVFDGEPRKKRWTLCVQMIVETWMALGPQKDHVPTQTFCLPDGKPLNAQALPQPPTATVAEERKQ